MCLITTRLLRIRHIRQKCMFTVAGVLIVVCLFQITWTFRLAKEIKSYKHGEQQAVMFTKKHNFSLRNPGSKHTKNSSQGYASEQLCFGEKIQEYVFKPLFGSKVMLFSAFWDERPNDFDNLRMEATIRIVAAVHRKNKDQPLYCAFHVKGGTMEVPVAYYEVTESHNRQWAAHILSCKVPSDIKVPICKVTVFSGRYDKAETLFVHTTKPSQTQLGFSTCVPPLYGNVSTVRLVEFIETTRSLGSEHITFYRYNVTESTDSVLDYYLQQGFITVIPWDLHPDISQNIWYNGQMIAVEDCLYRRMAHTQYLTFNDIDEFIVPSNQNISHWSVLLPLLEAPNVAGLSFKSAFYDPTKSHGSGDLANFPALGASIRTKQLIPTRSMCMIHACDVFEQGIHHVSKPTLAHLKITQTNVDLAHLHHYSQCRIDRFTRYVKCDEVVSDTSLHIHRSTVYPRVKSVLKALGI